MAWPAVKKHFDQDAFRKYVPTLPWGPWRPTIIMIHNTGAPTLEQYMRSAEDDRKKGLFPGTTRMNNMENYFHVELGWSGAPHMFTDPLALWEFNPLTKPGVHSPSYNSTAIGIEMIGDYSLEDDDSGLGLAVKQNTVFAVATLCSTLGLDPMSCIRLHKDDPITTHRDCPGEDVARDRNAIIASVAALMQGGEHDPRAVAIAGGDVPRPAAPAERRGVAIANDLNFRRGPGVTNESIGKLNKGDEVAILAEAPNGVDRWLKVRTRGGYVGWVAGPFVRAA